MACYHKIANYGNTRRIRMLKISKNRSLTLSILISVLFFIGCVAGLFILPSLTETLINLSDNIGNRENITQAGRWLVLILAYGIVLDFILRAIICFEFIFVYVASYGYKVINLHMNIQLFTTIC